MKVNTVLEKILHINLEHEGTDETELESDVEFIINEYLEEHFLKQEDDDPFLEECEWVTSFENGSVVLKIHETWIGTPK